MEEKFLIGFHKFFSKKKNAWYLVADTKCNCTSRDKSNGYFGDEKVEQIFIPEELWEFFEKQPEKIIGKTLIFEYVISGRYFNLDNIRIKG